jgi:hypothetical protein
MAKRQRKPDKPAFILPKELYSITVRFTEKDRVLLRLVSNHSGKQETDIVKTGTTAYLQYYVDAIMLPDKRKGETP